MENPITVTMPIGEYERLKWIERTRENLIRTLKHCMEIEHAEPDKTNLIIRTAEVVELVASYNDYEYELKHFDEVIVQPYKGQEDEKHV
ncbi:hypothetical protein [Lysinibacillus parviboronicapiens]|uniref:hypothetical protein n=1 Tax=Lysinibacillus parviboronicapiens TaxID=436516 RepID=UPI000D3610C8|nr:hypothetical protein [Lysinibacillus parviboronicapiens]